MSDYVIRKITLPLVGGGFAVLEVPLPLTEESYAGIMHVLAVMKPGLVAPVIPASPDRLRSATEGSL